MMQLNNCTISTKDGKKIVQSLSFILNENDKLAIIGEECNVEYVKYYMVLIYTWFYELGGPKYKDFVATKMSEMINN